MSFIGSMFDSSKGAGYSPSGVDQGQLDTAYGQTQGGIKQQQDFVNALMVNGGLSNQADVYSQQQGLANQLQGLANGTGPNPAQMQLNQATGQNVANQAALMAGQRGAAANPGLIARLAAQQGSNIQQQAAGQAATLGAQQQIAAMQQLQNQQANMANMANTQLGQRQTGLQALNNATLGQQSNLLGLQANMNATGAGIAGSNVNAQSGLLGGLLGGVGAALMPTKKAAGGEVEDPVDVAAKEIRGNPLQGPIGRVGVADGSGSSGLQSNTAKILAGSGAGAGMAGAGGGGGSQGSGLFGQMLTGYGMNALMGGGEGASAFGTAAPWELGGGLAGGAGDAMGGADVLGGLGAAFEGGGALAGLGEAAGVVGEGLAAIAPVAAVAAANQGGMIDGQDLANQKEMVPGKAEVKGDSLRNDKVPAILSPKEIVIPRSIALHPNAPELAKQFVADIIAKNKQKSGNFDEGGQQAQPGQPTVVINNGQPQGNSPFAISGPQAAAMGDYVNTPQQASQQALMQSPAFQQKAAQDAQNRAALQALLPRAPQAQVPGMPQMPGMPNAQTPQDLFGIDASNAAYKKGMGEEQHGLEEQKEAQTTQATGNVANMAPMIQQKKDQFNEYKSNVDNLTRERETFLKDYQDSKIDPNSFMNSLNPLQKFGTAIGLALGGMGSGLTHQPNAALDFLNKQIDRDIQGQLQNREAKGNLLKANMEQFHNLRDAVEMTRVQMTDLMTNEMGLEAQKAGGQEANARYLMLKGGLDKQNADRIGSMAMRNVMMQAQSGMGPAGQLPIQTRINLMRSVDTNKAKDLESRYIPGVDALAAVPVPPEARKEMVARKDLQDKLERLEQFAEKHQGTVMDRTTVNQGSALAKQAQDAYRSGHNQGVFKESEKEFVEGVIHSDPTAFFGNLRTIPGYKSAVSENRKSLSNMYNEFGINLGQNMKNFEGAPKLGR